MAFERRRLSSLRVDRFVISHSVGMGSHRGRAQLACRALLFHCSRQAINVGESTWASPEQTRGRGIFFTRALPSRSATIDPHSLTVSSDQYAYAYAYVPPGRGPCARKQTADNVHVRTDDKDRGEYLFLRPPAELINAAHTTGSRYRGEIISATSRLKACGVESARESAVEASGDEGTYNLNRHTHTPQS